MFLSILTSEWILNITFSNYVHVQSPPVKKNAAFSDGG